MSPHAPSHALAPIDPNRPCRTAQLPHSSSLTTSKPAALRGDPSEPTLRCSSLSDVWRRRSEASHWDVGSASLGCRDRARGVGPESSSQFAANRRRELHHSPGISPVWTGMGVATKAEARTQEEAGIAWTGVARTRVERAGCLTPAGREGLEEGAFHSLDAQAAPCSIADAEGTLARPVQREEGEEEDEACGLSIRRRTLKRSFSDSRLVSPTINSFELYVDESHRVKPSRVAHASRGSQGRVEPPPVDGCFDRVIRMVCERPRRTAVFMQRMRVELSVASLFHEFIHMCSDIADAVSGRQ